MLLEDKVAVVHGGAGAVGAAVAERFATEGARVFLTGRRRAPLGRVADRIGAAGGSAELDVLDVLDERAVHRHADGVVDRAGSIDIVLNAVGFRHVQGTAFLDLPVEEFLVPVDSYLRATYHTAGAAASHMAGAGRGVLLTVSTPGARLSGRGFLGNGVASAAIEAFSRILAGELGPSGVRLVCLRPDAIPDAADTSHTAEAFRGMAKQHGTTVEALLASRASSATLLGRLPNLDEVAHTAAFLASDRASATTGAIANLTCGSLVD